MICSIGPALIGNKEVSRPVIVARSRAALAAARRELDGSVGLVPTMGALHPGHLALLRAARRESDAVIATLFVNPTQFAPDEDFRSYPSDEPADLATFDAAGVELVFAPPAEEIYPEGFATTVDPRFARDHRRGRQPSGPLRRGRHSGGQTPQPQRP